MSRMGDPRRAFGHGDVDPSTELLEVGCDARAHEDQRYRFFDRGRQIKTFCVISVIVTWILSSGCLAFSIYIIQNNAAGEHLYRFSRFERTALPLVLNVVVALCTDAVGYVHTVSLRWSLKHEGRLYWNSNLRLFSSSRKTALNAWFANALCAVSLIVCYVATSQTFIETPAPTDGSDLVDGIDVTSVSSVNGIALAALGTGLLVQTVVATLCLMYQSEHIPTWSSNPLTTVLACFHLGLHRQEGRCMLSAASINLPCGPAKPSLRQPSMRRCDTSIRWITRFLWLLVPLSLLWACIILGIGIRTGGQASPELAKDSPFKYPVSFPLNVGGTQLQLFVALVMVCAIQSLATLGIHCAELVVNRSRDETLWRQAALASPSTRNDSTPSPLSLSLLVNNLHDPPPPDHSLYPDGSRSPRSRQDRLLLNKNAIGARTSYNSFLAAATSWPTLYLFAMKPLTHWIFGLGIRIAWYGDIMCLMSHVPLFILAALALLLALFANFLTQWRPRGPQPAAWGRLQTLADLIDDWGEGADGKGDSGRLWWGDKGEERLERYAFEGGKVAEEHTYGLRHAGTSSKQGVVCEILLDGEYAGVDVVGKRGMP